MLLKNFRLKTMLLVLTNMTVVSLYANINNLKGTFSILKDQYKEFSIINGAIATHTDYLMHLYDYGTFGKERKVKGADNETILVPDASNAPEVVKLMHYFFYRVPGHNSRGDFVFSDAIKTASAEDIRSIINAVAWIMAQIKKTSEEISKSKKIRTQFDAKIKGISLKDYSIRSDLENLRYLATLEGTASLTTQDNERLKLFKIIWLAYIDEQTNKAVFPPHTIDTVLLGIVYKLAGDSKALIRMFYEKLNDLLSEPGETIFVNDELIEASWLEEKFDPSDTAEVAAPIIFKADDIEQLKQYYENIVYLCLLPGSYPEEASYTSAFYKYDTSKIVSFPDCMETTLRNIVNVLLYDRDTREFDAHKISGAAPTQELIKFYTDNKTATDTENSNIHNQWTAIIENIPFATYKQKLNPKDGKLLEAAGKLRFIKIPKDVQITLPDQYIRAEQDDIVFEIKASLKNLIIVFNHIFGLNLFTDEKGTTPHEQIGYAFVRNDFIKEYFPKMCQKLGVEFLGFSQAGSPVDDIDSKDYGPIITTRLKIYPDAPAADIEIKTQLGHGELKIIDMISEYNPMAQWLTMNEMIIKQTINDASPLFNLPYLTVFRNYISTKNVAVVSDYIQFAPLKYSLNMIFYLPIMNSDFVRILSDKLIHLKSPMILDGRGKDLFFMLYSKFADPIQKQTALIILYHALVGQGKKVPGAVNAAIEGVKFDNDDVKVLAFNLLTVLVEQGQAFPEALAAGSGINSDDRLVVSAVTRLFNALVRRGQGFQQAIDLAAKFLKSNPKYAALQLFDAIIEQGQGFLQALDAVNEIRKQVPDLSTRFVRSDALKLYKKIISKLKETPREKLMIEPYATYIKHAISLGTAADTPLLKEAQEFEHWVQEQSQNV